MGIAELLGLIVGGLSWIIWGQSGEIGTLEAKIEQLEPIAKQCATQRGPDHRASVDAADERHAAEQRISEAVEEYRDNVINTPSIIGPECANSGRGAWGRRMVDEEQRFMDELRRVPD